MRQKTAALLPFEWKQSALCHGIDSRPRGASSETVNGAWADDPHTVDAETIRSIQIVRTVVGGTISYQVWQDPAPLPAVI
jgi:hypothetical protein